MYAGFNIVTVSCLDIFTLAYLSKVNVDFTL